MSGTFVTKHKKTAVRCGRKWLSGFGLNAFTDGCSKDLGLGAQTIQAIGQQYALSRKTHKKRWLRFRGTRAFVWVPFKALGIKATGDGVKFVGHVYRVWLSRPVFERIQCSSFAHDAPGPLLYQSVRRCFRGWYLRFSRSRH